jgi:hypothetical protein
VGSVVKGGAEVRSALVAMDLRVDVATVAGIKALQNDAKKNVRSRMRGRPRWDRRGTSPRTGVAVNLGLSPHHVTKSGGPGKLTGTLARAVGGKRRIEKRGVEWVGGVGVGGINVTNLYRKQVEARYPYLEPGVKKTEGKAQVLVEAAWAKAVH